MWNLTVTDHSTLLYQDNVSDDVREGRIALSDLPHGWVASALTAFGHLPTVGL